MAFEGTFKDSSGNELHPKTIAERVLVQTEDGALQPLSDVLADLNIVPAIIKEQSNILQSTINAGDMYTVPPYVVGAGRIQVWVDGAYSSIADGMWQEYGTAGETSPYILINEEISAGKVITVRVGQRIENFAATLSDAVDSESSDVGASSKAVKAAYDEARELDFAVIEADAQMPANLRETGLYFQKAATVG